MEKLIIVLLFLMLASQAIFAAENELVAEPIKVIPHEVISLLKLEKERNAIAKASVKWSLNGQEHFL
ncbi:hypothetical protein BCF11_5072 [Collimonas sp. PA-H2]|uniref:hypothetical protein n=1 Tax=Collimonas sp. PA-H2 TaxID=1881062 RepID=UPI000BF9189E|nr:hypothetical protein [Collimonas sp. PA-H2]PFH12586.1 hypothetical protein BCF11_5072 [Collimonas sp. PA-H2]